MTHRERIDMYIRLGYTVSGGKGSQTDQTAAHQSLSFMENLQSDFKSLFGKQQQVLSFLQGKLTQMFTNPQGFQPATMTAMQSNATNTVAQQTAQAEQAAQLSSAAHGGTGLPSGVQAQVAGDIAAAGSNQLAGEKNQIQIANGQLQNQNQWTAENALFGTAEAQNPLGYASAAGSTGGEIANLSNASTQADQSGFLGKFANSFGSSLGSSLGSGSASFDSSGSFTGGTLG